MAAQSTTFGGNYGRLLTVLAFAWVLLAPSVAPAATIFESATNPVLGQSGNLLLDTNAFIGSRMTLTQTVSVTHVGAHLLTTNPADPNSLFYAIVPLPCGVANCFPADPWMIETAAVASTLFASASTTSTDHLTPLSVVLPPGDYGLVLGGGLSAPIFNSIANPFGSTASGKINSFNTIVSGSTFFFYNAGNFGWADFFGNQPPLRFVVEGTVVPKPGDFDGDGDVDGFDFLELQRGLGTIYDATDLATWEANYPMAAPLSATSAAVPEPATWIALLLGMAAMLFRRDAAVS